MHFKHFQFVLFAFGMLWTSFTITLSTGELFTALAEMEEVLETEAVLISNLQSYLDAQEDKLNYLRR